MRRLVFIAVLAEDPDGLRPRVLMTLVPASHHLWSSDGPRYSAPHLLRRTSLDRDLPQRPFWLVGGPRGRADAVRTDWILALSRDGGALPAARPTGDPAAG